MSGADLDEAPLEPAAALLDGVPFKKSGRTSGCVRHVLMK
jgi:hypothetical protein